MHHHLHRYTHFCHLSTSSLPPSALLSDLLQGRIPYSHLLQIHARVFRINAHQDNLIATRLIGHYPSKQALKLFNLLKQPNIFPFNALIRVLSEEGLYYNALLVFKRSKLLSLSPNDLTFSFILKACFKANNDSVCVEQIHVHILKLGFVCNFYVCNGLLNVYAKALKDLVAARKVFDEMPDKSVVCCWTNLISGYAASGQSEEALRLFLLMVKENFRPENDTMVNVLSACSNLEMVNIENWVKIFTEIVNNFNLDILAVDSVNAVLVYLYGKWGKVDKSRERFDRISEGGKRNVLSWNALIGAYVQNGCALEALGVFRLMMECDCSPNHVTMVSVLSACAQIGDLDLGIWVHEYMRTKGRTGVIVSNTNLATALIDMYSKCGNLDKAREVFELMIKKDVVSFNATIMGMAINGKGEEAFKLFSRMQVLGLHPDTGTFLGLLCACSHSGLLEKGRQIFKDMSQHFAIAPKLEHYASYIDLLARVGCLEEAVEVVSRMPFEPNNYVWGALLSGCMLHNQLELAQIISAMLLKVDPENSAGYVMLSNAFAVDNHWADVSGLRYSMREKGVVKHPGCSCIAINGVLLEFLAGSALHPQPEIVRSMLNSLLKEMESPTLKSTRWDLILPILELKQNIFPFRLPGPKITCQTSEEFRGKQQMIGVFSYQILVQQE